MTEYRSELQGLHLFVGAEISIPNSPSAIDDVAQDVLHLTELPDSTVTVLYMLAQGTEHAELKPAAVRRASVYLVLMPRTLQMRIQRMELAEFFVAKETFIAGAIERSFGRPLLHVPRLRVGSRSSNKTSRVGDNVVPIHLNNLLIQSFASHSRATGARFKMKDQCSSRDEWPSTGAESIRRFVD